jgi:peptidoglycan/xylan/chitin deacetylase (PgdA/CDA1 family)
MDGTASLIYLLAAKEDEAKIIPGWHTGDFLKHSLDETVEVRALVRGDSTKKNIALVFTADEYAEGLPVIQKALLEENIKASFFFTGRLYRNKQYHPLIKQLFQQKHYLGPHSDQHILYNDWKNRDSMLVTRDSLEKDYRRNITAMKQLGVYPANRLPFFIPPYEWWNKRIGKWFAEMGVKLFSFTPGTRTNADYTWPEMGASYKSSEELMQLLRAFEAKHTLNGAILLIHAGTDPRRKDKLYNQLPVLIQELRAKGYSFEKIDGL